MIRHNEESIKNQGYKKVYFFTLVIICCCVFALFQIKFRVHNLHKEVKELEKMLEHEKNSIHVLKAEWTYLNQPERLQRLAEKFLNLSELHIDQIMLATKDTIIIAQQKEQKISQNNFNAINDNNQLIKASFSNQESHHNKPAKIKWRYKDRPDLTRKKK